MKTSYLKLSILTGLATLVGALGLHAADLTWDTDPTVTTGPQDGPGTWTASIANPNWWDGAVNTNWNNAPPDNAIFGAGSGAAGTVTVPGLTTNTVGNITFNAPGSGGYNIAAGSSTTSKLNLSGTPTITVAGGVFATNLVVLSGTSFTKLGAGTFVLKPGAANIYSGPTVAGEGTLILGSTTDRLLIPGDLIITNGSTAQLGATDQITNSATLTVTGATFDMSGKSETVGNVILDNNGLILGASSSRSLTATNFDIRSGRIEPVLAGASAALTKTTPGTARLGAAGGGGNPNTYGGGTTVNEGVLELAESANKNALPGNLTINAAGTVRVVKENQLFDGAEITIDGGTLDVQGGNETVAKTILKSGSILSANRYLTNTASCDLRSGTVGAILAGSAPLIKTTAATVMLTLNNVNDGGVLISEGILQLGDGSGVNKGQFGSGPVTNNAAIVLNHSASFTLANVISGSGSLTNLGGSPTVTGDNTYAGGTTVSGGTLFVNNTTGSGTGSGAVEIQPGATLAGTGTVGGVVNVQSSGTLSPGTAIGTLTINGNLTLDASSTSTFDVNGTTPANDSVVLGASVAYGGTLNIVAGGAFFAGQQFVLFSGTGATNASNFANIVGSPGVVFNFTNGVLSVVSVTPPTLLLSVAGNILTFSWAEAGFKLQSQTNSTGIGTNWFNYPDVSNPVNVTVDLANPSVFFRLSN